MKLMKYAVIFISAAIMTGCATGLNSIQKREYAAFENEGVLIEEKNPSLGVALGLLPGFGSFYAREPGYGIANLLLWPLSIIWDPVSGYDGSMVINYDLTRHHIKRMKEKELSVLEDKLTIGEIDQKDYVLAKNKIRNKYDFE